MSLKLSTALANQLMGGDDLAATLSGCKLYLYSGAEPASADAADAGTLVAEITKDGDGATGLTFATPATNGVIQKTAAEVWKCLAANITAGTVTHYRLCVGTDDGSAAAGASDYRIQGSVGTDMSFDLVLPATALTTGADVGPISPFGFQLPLAA